MRETYVCHLKGQACSIFISEGLSLDEALFARLIPGRRVLIVSNKIVFPLYGTKLQKTLSFCQVDTCILPDGESYKTMNTWSLILDRLIEANHHRDTTILGLGGGVIGDLSGFAAATYQRGVRFIQVPTTLLAQVDASLGGKTAINHPSGKNMIGAFHQAAAVVIDPCFLKTLPAREFSAGLAEVVKHAMIADTDFFGWLEANAQLIMAHDAGSLFEMIQRAAGIKSEIVSKDGLELGERAHLNLGHTFAHAIEFVLSYGVWLHGEAVSVGLILACKLSELVCSFDAGVTHRVIALLRAFNLPVSLPEKIDIELLMQSLQMDKKVLKSRVRFILLSALASPLITDQVDVGVCRDLLISSSGLDS